MVVSSIYRYYANTITKQIRGYTHAQHFLHEKWPRGSEQLKAKKGYNKQHRLGHKEAPDSMGHKRHKDMISLNCFAGSNKQYRGYHIRDTNQAEHIGLTRHLNVKRFS